MAGISSKALGFGGPENKKKFNGIEHTTDLDLNQYDAFYRNLDPQIGRWWQIDPLADLFESYSSYESMDNNPISYLDPLGDFKTRFGAWLNKVFNGGQAVRKNEFGEWYVVKTKTGADADGNPTITASRYYGKGRNQYSSAGEENQSEQENKEFVDRLVNKGVLVRTSSLEEANANNLRAFTGVLLPNVIKGVTSAVKTSETIEKVAKTPVGRSGNPIQIVTKNMPTIINGRKFVMPLIKCRQGGLYRQLQ